MGCPKAAHGKWDVKTVLNWWLQNIHRTTTDLQESREKYWDAKARRENIRADQEEGALVEIKQVEADFFEHARRTRDAILNVPDRIGGELAGCTDQHVVTMKLTEELIQALTELANDDYPTPEIDEPAG